MKGPSKSISPLFKLNSISAISSRFEYEFSLSKSISYLSKSETQNLSSSCFNFESSTNVVVESFGHNVSPKPKIFELELKNAKPISRTSYFDPTLFRFSQRRSFSTVPSDPSFRKTDDSVEGNVSSNGEKLIFVESDGNSPFENSSSTIDAGHSIRKPISLWPGTYHSPVTNALWDARSSIFERLINPTVDAPTQSELITKTPSMSRTSVGYKFSTDFILREQYRNPWNEIRMGKLLEDLDALAGTISFKVRIICIFYSFMVHIVWYFHIL